MKVSQWSILHCAIFMHIVNIAKMIIAVFVRNNNRMLGNVDGVHVGKAVSVLVGVFVGASVGLLVGVCVGEINPYPSNTVNCP